MGHVVRNAGWATLDINTTSGRILVQEDWVYNWTVVAGATAWTADQQRNFHNTLDRQIWGAWSNRIRLSVAGNATFARNFHAQGVPVNFDVRRVLNNGHWTVNVRKLPAGGSHRSTVDFPNRVINLDSEDLAAHGACNEAVPQVCLNNFLTVPHEFGHTMDQPDEYVAGHGSLNDERSIMNVGQELRPRHLSLLLGELNTMINNCTFSYP